MKFYIPSRTFDDSILEEYIAQYPGMYYTSGEAISAIRPDYVIDTDKMSVASILNWIDAQSEYGEVECNILKELCRMYDLPFDSANSAYERLSELTE